MVHSQCTRVHSQCTRVYYKVKLNRFDSKDNDVHRISFQVARATIHFMVNIYVNNNIESSISCKTKSNSLFITDTRFFQIFLANSFGNRLKLTILLNIYLKILFLLLNLLTNPAFSRSYYYYILVLNNSTTLFALLIFHGVASVLPLLCICAK